MAQFQSEIELRVKVLDKELADLEKRIAKVANPFSASGARRKDKSFELKAEKQVLQTVQRLNVERIKSVNLNTSWYKALQQGKQIQLDINKAVAKEAQQRKRVTDALAKQQKQQKNRRAQDILLGGGFPLLFGAGPGQAIAGALGGAIGGFGGGIAAQAAVAAIAQLNEAITSTAAVTASTAASFEFLTENQLYSSDETRRLADELAELGKVEELAALNTKELVRLIGNEGVENLQALDTEWRELLSNIAQLGLAIAAFISKYLEPVIALLNNAVGNVNTRNSFESLRGDLRGTPLGAQLEADIKAARQANGRGARSGALQTSDMEALLKKYLSQRPVTAEIPVTDKDRKEFKPPKNSAADDLERQLAAGEKLARQFRQQTEILNAESDLAEKLLRISHQREEVAIRIKETAAASQQAELLAANAELGRLQTAKAFEEFGKKSVESADKFLEKLLLQEQAETRKKELIAQGILPNLAEELVKIEQQTDKLKTNLDLDIATLDAIKAEVEARGGNVKAIEKEIDALKKKKKEIEGAAGKAKAEAEKDSSFGGRLESEIEKQQEKLNALIDPVNQVVGAANAIGDAFGQAFSDVISGSKSAQEALADMFKNIGMYFIDMAAKMIAEYVKLILMQTILNALGGPAMGSGGGGSGGYTIPEAAVPKTSPKTFAGAFADGGYVGANRVALVGERGPELISTGGQPAQVMSNEQSKSAMSMYNPANSIKLDARQTAPNNYNFTTLRIADEEYVSREQLVEAMQRASADGAKKGEAMTLARLQNSRSSRSKLGL